MEKDSKAKEIIRLLKEAPWMTNREIARELRTTKMYVDTVIKRARKEGEKLPSREERERLRKEKLMKEDMVGFMEERRRRYYKMVQTQKRIRERVAYLRKVIREKLIELYGYDFPVFLEEIYPYLIAFFSDKASSWEEDKLETLLHIIEEELEAYGGDGYGEREAV